MSERYHYHPSQDAQDTLTSIEQHFGWAEPQQPFRYAPSPDQVLPEEAATEEARRNAASFVLELIRAAVPSDGQTPLLLTPDEVRARYEEHSGQQTDVGDTPRFSLREAWGAAERMRRHVHERARATDDWDRLAIGRQLHRVADLIEDALPEDERPLPF